MFDKNNPETWPVLLNLRQVQAIVGIGKGKALAMIKSGNLPMTKLRGSYVINHNDLFNWLQNYTK